MTIRSYEYSYSNAAALWSIACARSSTRNAFSSPEGKSFLNTRPNASLSIYCRDRGVEGSCAKRLNIEFYTVVILLIIIVINISILSPVPLSFEA